MNTANGPSQRATCPVCGVVRGVRVNGTMRQHLGSRYDSSGIFREMCPGTGQPANARSES